MCVFTRHGPGEVAPVHGSLREGWWPDEARDPRSARRSAGRRARKRERRTFPEPVDNSALDLVAYRDPALHDEIAVWHYAAPGIATLLAGSLVLSVWRVWLRPRRGSGRRGKLPPWPVSPADPSPSVVVGKLHHPTAPRESDRPSWLVIPETGLDTGMLFVGAIGSGKTSACIRSPSSCSPNRPTVPSAGPAR